MTERLGCESKELAAVERNSEAVVRGPWRRPTNRVLRVERSEADINSRTDGSVFS